MTEFWLGYQDEPIARMREAGGWSPDDPSAYCPRCGESVGPHEVTSSGCSACRSSRSPFHRFYRLGRYEGELRECILAIKFHRRWELGRSLGGLLGQAIVESPLETGFERIVVPMPMPWPRRLYRGIDHAGILAAMVAEQVGARVAQPLYHRNGPPQVLLTGVERRKAARSLLGLRSASGAFGRLRVPPLGGTEVILVDDVRTTGGSLDAAAKLLQRFQPARIVAAVAAVADSPGRTGRVADSAQ